MTIKFKLVKKATGLNYSIEAGLHDGLKNWDHHPGSFVGEQPPSPANNSKIPSMEEGEDYKEWGNHVVEISHIDADTLLGILRLLGQVRENFGYYGDEFRYKREDDGTFASLDTSLIERIDLNGSSVVKNKYNPSLLFMVGVGAYAREINFPRLAPDQEELDVTEYVQKILDKSFDNLIRLGRQTQDKAEKAYLECEVKRDGSKGLWVVGPDDAFDPSRPYEDGVSTVVVYRQHYKSISIYADPKSSAEYGGREIAGIVFAGHAKACGSPRGQEMSLEDAKKVFLDI